MYQAEVYKKMKPDLSGSRSKNRFRLELLWGIDKMLELMEAPDDFTVVFDYVCDIEVHKQDSFEFYQIKTHKESQPKYTVKNLVNIPKGKEGSVLGKLFALVEAVDCVEVILVCNRPFSTITDEPGLISLNKLENDDKEIIKKAIKAELGIENIDFSKSYYLYTHMNLADPEKEIKGALISSFELIKGSEPQNPNALYRLVYSEVVDKASFEYTLDDYDELLNKKGISRRQFDRMLDAHCLNEKTGITATMNYINSLSNIRDKRIYKKALTSLMPKLAKSKQLQELESQIALFLDDNPELTEMEEILDAMTGEFHSKFSVEYDNAEKTVLYILVIKKYEEGGYDNEVDF